jgi:eukaryotic-like serine/threonine-protein kinase
LTIDSRLSTALADRYRIERELGQGGMATVYLAQDLKHDRQVAIKVLRPELAAVIGAERFLTEIKTTANLQHPHILPLHDSGAAGSFLYYVMPFVEGESLRNRLSREKQLPITDAVRIATEVAGALDYAHRHGVIHRDIKPENILLHDGRALVADFGIALAASKAGGTRMTETGMSLGTPHYMSPEQAMGEREITPRSDVYALGCITYEMLVGEPPFTGPTAQSIVAKVMTAEPAAPSSLRKTVPEPVESAVLTALEKLPADRWASAKEFGDALAGRTDGQTSRRTVSGLAAQRRSIRPSFRMSVLIAGLALLATIPAYRFGRASRSAGPSVYDAALPDTAPISFAASTATASYGVSLRNLSVTAKGEFVVYAAREDDSTVIWYRSLRDGETHAIQGTTGGTAPRVSPDGSQVVFLHGDRVYLVPITGGEPRLLLDGLNTGSMDWLPDGKLLVGDNDGSRLSWIDPAGGTPRSRSVQRCTFWSRQAESGLLLCSTNNTGTVLDPETGERSSILATGLDGKPAGTLAGSGFRVVDGKYLVYISWDGNLVAARYNVKTKTAGRPVTLRLGVRREAVGEAQFDLTSDGTLVFAPGVDATLGQVVRLGPDGVSAPLLAERGNFQRYDLSRDRRWFAASVLGPEGNELRVYDLQNGQRYTWFKADLIRHPLWSLDGEELLVVARDSIRWSVLRGSPSSGRAPDTVAAFATDPSNPDVIDWHDPHVAIAQDWSASVVMRFDPTSSPPQFDTLVTGARFASVSANGKLLLYQAMDGNRIVATSFPNPGRRWQLASDGIEPFWLSGDQVMFRLGVSWFQVKVNPETGEPTGPPVFWGRDRRFSDTSGWSNRPSHDGGILYLQGPKETSAPYLRVVPNWVAQMKAAVAAADR